MKREYQGAGTTVHAEIEKLFEAMALGELDEPGLARLRELASADPALATRLREELAIDAMLAGLGPNHAPKGLSNCVFERLDADEGLSAVDITQAVQRTFTGRRTGFPWIPMNYLRWASAVAILGLAVFEVSLLVMQHRHNALEPGSNYAMNLGRALQTPAAQLVFEEIEDEARQAVPDRMLAMRARSKTSESTQPPPISLSNAIDGMHGLPHMPIAKDGGSLPADGQSMDGDLFIFESSSDHQDPLGVPELALGTPQTVLAASAPPEVTPEVHKEATEVPESVLAMPAKTTESIAPVESVASEYMAAAATPVAKPKAKAAADPSPSEIDKPLPRVLERQVALRMPLAVGASGAVRIAPSTDLGGLVNSLKDSNGQEPIKQSLINGDVIRTGIEKSMGKAVSLRDVEMAVAVAGGDIVARERIAGEQEAWKITARMTPASLKKFLEKYAVPLVTAGDYGVKSGETKDGDIQEDRIFPYTVVKGRNLLWALGFTGETASRDQKTTGSHELTVPLAERPAPRPDQKIDVIIHLGGTIGKTPDQP